MSDRRGTQMEPELQVLFHSGAIAIGKTRVGRRDGWERQKD